MSIEKFGSLWKLVVLYIELVLCVILIFKINIKFFGPHKAYLGFIEHIFTAWGCSYVACLLKNWVPRPWTNGKPSILGHIYLNFIYFSQSGYYFEIFYVLNIKH